MTPDTMIARNWKAHVGFGFIAKGQVEVRWNFIRATNEDGEPTDWTAYSVILKDGEEVSWPDPLAFVVDGPGRLIKHSPIEFVLFEEDESHPHEGIVAMSFK